MNPGQDSDDEIDFSLDDLNWPPIVSGPSGSGGISPGVTTSGGIPQGFGTGTSGTITIPGSTSSTAAGITITTSGSSTIWNLGTVSSTSMMTTAISKKSIAYVIVLEDGSCVELEEKNPITAREIIGFGKFFNMVSMVVNGGMNVMTKWSDLIITLGIDRHFIPGQADMTMYDDSGEILYVFLFDDE